MAGESSGVGVAGAVGSMGGGDGPGTAGAGVMAAGVAIGDLNSDYSGEGAEYDGGVSDGINRVNVDDNSSNINSSNCNDNNHSRVISTTRKPHVQEVNRRLAAAVNLEGCGVGGGVGASGNGVGRGGGAHGGSGGGGGSQSAGAGGGTRGEFKHADNNDPRNDMDDHRRRLVTGDSDMDSLPGFSESRPDGHQSTGQMYYNGVDIAGAGGAETWARVRGRGRTARHQARVRPTLERGASPGSTPTPRNGLHLTSGEDSGLGGVDFLSSPGGTGSLFDGFCSPLSEYNGSGAEMTPGCEFLSWWSRWCGYGEGGNGR